MEHRKDPTRAELRQFATIWLPLALMVVAGASLYRTGSWRLAFQLLPVALASLVTGIIAPARMRPVFLGLLAVTYPIGWVVSRLVLVMVYWLVMTPIGVLLRLTGHDALWLRHDPSTQSFWRRRETPDDKRYLRQF